jgi:hypothetical protein
VIAETWKALLASKTTEADRWPMGPVEAMRHPPMAEYRHTFAGDLLIIEV